MDIRYIFELVNLKTNKTIAMLVMVEHDDITMAMNLHNIGIEDIQIKINRLERKL